MRMTRPLALLATFAVLCAFPRNGATAETAPAPHEVRAEVLELVEFHEPIARLWHDAWPNKDYALMRTLAPEFQKGAEKVAAARLPGILREKQAAWDEGVKRLNEAVAVYAAAAGTEADTLKLLDAGEKLHMQFERMVRILRPALKELDAFHVVLYRLYHYDMPAGDLAAMKATIGQLKEPMAALNKAELPERRAALKPAFTEARQALSTAVDQLVTTARSKNKAKIKQAIEEMHSRYQALSKVFD